MDDLIKALQIFRKYANEQWPTHCEHDVMYVVGIPRDEMTEDDFREVERLGFFWDEEVFKSHKFGSA